MKTINLTFSVAILLIANCASPCFADNAYINNTPWQATEFHSPMIDLGYQEYRCQEAKRHVDANLDSFDKVGFDRETSHYQDTVEVIEVAYLDKPYDNFRKVIERYVGKSGERTLEYYFEDEGLRCVSEVIVTYGTENYSSYENNHYQFYEGKMVDWLNQDARRVLPNSDRYLEKEAELYSVYDKYE